MRPENGYSNGSYLGSTKGRATVKTMLALALQKRVDLRSKFACILSVLALSGVIYGFLVSSLLGFGVTATCAATEVWNFWKSRQETRKCLAYLREAKDLWAQVEREEQERE